MKYILYYSDCGPANLLCFHLFGISQCFEHRVPSAVCHTCDDVYNVMSTVLIGNFMTGYIRVELKNNGLFFS